MTEVPRDGNGRETVVGMSMVEGSSDGNSATELVWIAVTDPAWNVDRRLLCSANGEGVEERGSTKENGSTKVVSSGVAEDSTELGTDGCRDGPSIENSAVVADG